MFDKTQPLWLPKGSVQAILALIVTGTFAFLAVTGKLDPKDVLNVVLLVLGFYFIVKAALASPSNGG